MNRPVAVISSVKQEVPSEVSSGLSYLSHIDLGNSSTLQLLNKYLLQVP